MIGDRPAIRLGAGADALREPWRLPPAPLDRFDGGAFCSPCTHHAQHTRTRYWNGAADYLEEDVVRLQVVGRTVMRCARCGGLAQEPPELTIDRLTLAEERRSFRSRFRHPRHGRRS